MFKVNEEKKETTQEKPPLPTMTKHNEINNNTFEGASNNHDNNKIEQCVRLEEISNTFKTSPPNKNNRKRNGVSFQRHESIAENKEIDLYLKHVRNLKEEEEEEEEINEEMQNKEFIKRLANDFIHYKIYGKQNNFETENMLQPQSKLNENEDNSIPKSPKSPKLRKTSRVLRKVSLDMEQANSEFFDKVCDGLQIHEDNAEETFKLITEQVLNKGSLNWGRVVSLFTFGGKVAEWFWKTHQEEKIEEVEGWLAESISSTEDWIDERGGWDNFNETFEPIMDKGKYSWLKPGLMICAGVSLAAILTMTSTK